MTRLRILLGLKFTVVVLALFIGVIFGGNIHIVKPVLADNCTVPNQVQNVLITFPNCVGAQCDFTQANCTWGALTGATGYNVTITNSTTGTQISTQAVGAAVVQQSFAVTDGSTYTCSVAATNACGAGTASAFSLLCKVAAGVSTPTPIPPTAAPPPPKPTPIPMKPTGSNVEIFAGLGAVAFLIGGFFLLFM